jgi:N utilization substance protein B
MSAAPRAQSRQVALQVLYAVDVGRHGAEAIDPTAVESALAELAANFELPGGARAYASQLALGVARERAAIDRLIAAHATNWRIERMAAVDRNVLRLAVYEMGWAELPPSVAIDEAVELARRFGSDPSPAFVNGVLDAIAHTLASGGRGESEAGEAPDAASGRAETA